MNGQERIRELLGTALEGEPPSAVDTDALVRLGRRRVRVRRMIPAAGVLAVAALLLVGAALLRPLLADDHTDAATTPTITAAPDTNGVGPDGVTDNQLNQIMTVLMTGDWPPGKQVVKGSLTFSSRGTTATLSVTLIDDKGTGTLTVTRMATNLPADQLCPPAARCDSSKHSGQNVATYTHVVIAPYGIETIAIAQNGHVRAIAVSANFTPNAVTWSRPSPPITDNQLAIIAAAMVRPIHP